MRFASAEQGTAAVRRDFGSEKLGHGSKHKNSLEGTRPLLPAGGHKAGGLPQLYGRGPEIPRAHPLN